MIAKKALYYTADRTKIVNEGDKAAAFLLVPAGREIPKDVIEKHGLKDDPTPHPVPHTLSTKDIEHRETRVPPVPHKRG